MLHSIKLKKYLALGYFWCFAVCLGAQSPLKPFQWRDHLSYNSAVSVTVFDNKLFAAVTSIHGHQTRQGLYYFDRNDNSYGRLSKIQGLSDVDPILVKTNTYNNTLLVVYANSNIDLIRNNQIYNISDILRKSIPGKKTINSVYFQKQYAYLATGFGIVVLNTDNYEVKDTYFIGNNGSSVNVYQVTTDQSRIYAATDAGILTAPLSSNNLANYQNWKLETQLPPGPYNCLINFKGKVLTNFSKKIQSQVDAQDTIFVYNGTGWTPYTGLNRGPEYTIKALIPDEAKGTLMILSNAIFHGRDENGNSLFNIWGYFQNPWEHNYIDAIIDPSEPETYWMADESKGLIKFKANASSSVGINPQKYYPNGPNRATCSEMKVVEGKVFIAPSNLGASLEPSWSTEGVYIMEGGQWKHMNKGMDGLSKDLNAIAVDSADTKHYFGGCWGRGVLEFYNDSVIKIYDHTNSALLGAEGSVPEDIRVNGVLFDKRNNLWVSESYNNKLLAVQKKDKTWQNFSFANFYPSAAISKKAFIDKNDQIWIIFRNSGMAVYKIDENYSQPNNTNTKKVSKTAGSGGLPTIDVNCLAEDKEGDIWVGTDEGLAVFYNPEQIFSDGAKWDAQQILIQQDGSTQVLLGTEGITSIAVDGANHKWIGTTKSGVFCLSPDGQKELYHFTTENSPLFSNSIIAISIDGKTGEVFIATEKGLISFQGINTEATSTFENVYAYPNPVKPNYNGPVLIKGMINGAIVKITDVAGNIVYETKAEGGQAIWNAKNFKGERVASGVYLALCATSDGEQKAITKILVIN